MAQAVLFIICELFPSCHVLISSGLRFTHKPHLDLNNTSLTV